MKDTQCISISNSKNHFLSYLIQYGWVFLLLISTFYYSFTNQILMRGDMLHYLDISIYMKTSHHFLYPSSYLHRLYLEKPPLIFWLINIGWLIFGVSYWWIQALVSLIQMTWIILSKMIYKKILL